MPQKEILIKIKHVRNKKILEFIFKKVLQQLLKYSTTVNTEKNTELLLVLVIDDIENKELLQIELNKKLQKELSNTKYSGQVLITNQRDVEQF